jgi:hypothetical protein
MLCSKKMILPSKFNVKLCSGSGFPKFSGGVKKKLGGGCPPLYYPYAHVCSNYTSTLLDATGRRATRRYSDATQRYSNATLTLLNATLMLL